ncbi:methionine ABC transporter permease [Burkholderia anthina]|uniref:methionine ABC transporter permease n=1 Tax=Burkholderia anthina TaxID=179879 RepID=UPI001589038D|nr:methionine ABC transporter permease [Burkholderia anthina]
MLELLAPHLDLRQLFTALGETIYMTGVAGVATLILGTLLGTVLFVTSRGQVLENRVAYFIVSTMVNVFRSVPFIILVVLLIPVTKAIVGTILGANAALPTLIIGASPFYARIVEIGLREVDKGIVEAARAGGATNATIVLKVLLPESSPSLVSGLTVTAIALVSYTTMAGVIGAGGLGNLAYLEGFQRNHNDVTVIATALILFIVFLIQLIGDAITKRIDKR